jgi:ubiquinone biosynthesis protein Coq4
VKALPLSIKFKFFKGILKVLWNPERTEGIFEAIDAVVKRMHQQQDEFADFANAIMDQPGVRQAAEERYLEPPVDLKVLEALPDGTLGREYCRHLQDNNLDPIFYPDINITNDIQWFSMRGRQVHDIFHVILGFGISVPDELGVQAYALGILSDPVAGMIVGGGLFNAGLKKPWTLPECMECIVRGFSLGRKSKNMIGRKFSEEWDRPLEDIRKELQIVV